MSGALRAILWGGTACAVLDGAAASLQFGFRGVKPLQVWQGVASGLLGPGAFRQGWISGGLGLLLHFTIAFTAAAVFAAASQQLPFLARSYWVSGPLYGIIVYLVMSLIVVPLSARPKMPKPPSVAVTQVIIHILFVGLPISIAANHFAFLD